MNFFIGTILLSLTLQTAPPSLERSYFLVDELPTIEAQTDSQFTILLQFQSLLGNRIIVEGTDLEFSLLSGQFPGKRILKNIEIRDVFILAKCKVEAKQGRYLITEIQRAPKPVECLNAVGRELERLDPARQLASLNWLLRNFHRDGNSTLDLEHRQQSEVWAFRLLSKIANTKSHAEQNIQLFVTSEKHFSANKQWMDLLIVFANKHSANAQLSPLLRKLGLVQDSQAWKSLAIVLKQFGLVAQKELFLTKPQARLRQNTQKWFAEERRKNLLRGLTELQYSAHAEASRLKLGMNRQELLNSYGYPSEVTWYKSHREFFEAWIYPAEEIYMIDGLIFEWKSRSQQ